jgi:hypothetical protein
VAAGDASAAAPASTVGALAVGLGDGLGAGLESGSAALKAATMQPAATSETREIFIGFWLMACGLPCFLRKSNHQKFMPMSKGHE